MPFELGLAVALEKLAGQTHRWFVFEEVAHRLTKSLSDLNGTDPLVHHGNPEAILRALSNALYRNAKSPTFVELRSPLRESRAAKNRVVALTTARFNHPPTCGIYLAVARDGRLFVCRLSRLFAVVTNGP
jgi:hypothetical protein